MKKAAIISPEKSSFTCNKQGAGIFKCIRMKGTMRSASALKARRSGIFSVINYGIAKKSGWKPMKNIPSGSDKTLPPQKKNYLERLRKKSPALPSRLVIMGNTQQTFRRPMTSSFPLQIHTIIWFSTKTHHTFVFWKITKPTAVRGRIRFLSEEYPLNPAGTAKICSLSFLMQTLNRSRMQIFSTKTMDG